MKFSFDSLNILKKVYNEIFLILKLLGVISKYSSSLMYSIHSSKENSFLGAIFTAVSVPDLRTFVNFFPELLINVLLHDVLPPNPKNEETFEKRSLLHQLGVRLKF